MKRSKLVDVVNSNNASSEPKFQLQTYLRNFRYWRCNSIFKGDTSKQVVINGRGNYGLKPSEDRIKDAIGDILLTSDSDVTSYNVVIEAQKNQDIQTNG